MQNIRLPEDLELKLESLARTTGHSASFHAEQAIIEYLEDLEDYQAAEWELAEVHAGRSVPTPLDELLKACGVAD